MDNQNVIDIFAKIFACYSLLTTIAAIILNPLVLYVCLRSKRLRSTSTFKILALSSINDLLVCIAWNQEDFTTTVLNYVTAYENLFYCRWISVFLQFTTLQLQSWILLSISTDRLLSMLVKKWSKFYFSGYRPYIYVGILYFVVSVINFHEVFTSGYSYYDDEIQKEIVICYVTDPSYGYDWYGFVAQVNVYFGFMAPVGLLIIVNILIIYTATKFSRAQKANAASVTSVNIISNKKKTQMTKMILFITFLYIALTLPGIILAGYFYVNIIYYPWAQLFVNIFNGVQFSYPALNFFILFASNKLFASEVKRLLFRIGKNKVSSETGIKTKPTAQLKTMGSSFNRPRLDETILNNNIISIF